MKDRARKLQRSIRYWERANRIIPTGTQCLSKGPTQYVQGVAPIYIQRGKGPYCWDVDGNKFLDYAMGLHSVMLGYSYPAVDRAIRRQLRDGINFSLMHPLEVEVAEQLIKVIPCAEAVRFGKNGSDVTSAAVRLARAYTGRDKIACCGYHGWQDWYVATTDRNIGVPKAVRDLTFVFRYNDIESLLQIFLDHPGQIACVIMEPITVIAPEDDFLVCVREACRKHGALLVFDEIISGFRFAIGGAQEVFGVTPDLATFGKAMGNGMPISTLVGRRDIMEKLNEVFFSFVFGGEALSLAAAEACLDAIVSKNVSAHLAKIGTVLQDGYNEIASRIGVREVTCCIGYPQRSVVTFEHPAIDPLEIKSLIQQTLLKRGVLWCAYHALSYSHQLEQIYYTLECFEDALRLVKKALDEGNVKKYLDGPPVEPVFRKVADFASYTSGRTARRP